MDCRGHHGVPLGCSRIASPYSVGPRRSRQAYACGQTPERGSPHANQPGGGAAGTAASRPPPPVRQQVPEGPSRSGMPGSQPVRRRRAREVPASTCMSWGRRRSPSGTTSTGEVRQIDEARQDLAKAHHASGADVVHGAGLSLGEGRPVRDHDFSRRWRGRAAPRASADQQLRGRRPASISVN